MKGDDRDVHKNYHDLQYGFPIDDDNELFCRLILEINQAGLSWTTILKKEKNFRNAYHNFKIKKVAAYKETDVARLLNDAGIIRNRLKINAAIENARSVIMLQKEHGSFRIWLDKNHPRTKAEWVKLFKQHFKFTGGEIVNEFRHCHSLRCGRRGRRDGDRRPRRLPATRAQSQSTAEDKSS